MKLLRLILLSLVIIGWCSDFQSALATDLLPAESPIAVAIDHYIEERLQREASTPAPGVDDAAFLRRVCLDLTGRIPTAKELQEFLALPAQERRSGVATRLMDSPDFAFHQANEIDLLLLAKIKKDNEWRAFLLEATRENRSWAELFRDVLHPDKERPNGVGSAAFLRERVRELDDLTNDTAILFFGVNISCAKCHDHPLVDDWQQDHYFGMASFFKRTYQTKAKRLAEHFEGDVKFTDLMGTEKQAAFMFLSNSSVQEPELKYENEARKQLEEAIKQSKNDEKAAAPEVAFSPRAELIRLALADEEKEFFARNIVNRVWERFLGRGLVMPLDQMHSGNPPSHPELMQWLVRDLKSHDYDLKRLIAGIVQSEVYARSCRWTAETDPPLPEIFAIGIVRPLNPRQLALSLIVASSNSDNLPGWEKPNNWEQLRTDLENRSGGFSDLFPIPDEGFQVGTDEALLFSNSLRFQNEFLRTSTDRLVGQLNNIQETDTLLKTLFTATLSRDPSSDEAEQFTNYLAAHHQKREEALQQLTWVLLASPEFRFNH